jgi:hypothetical protein
MENNNHFLQSYNNSMRLYDESFTKIENLDKEIKQILQSPGIHFPPIVGETYDLLKSKNSKIIGMIHPIEDSFKQFTQLKQIEDELNEQIKPLDAALQKIIQDRNEINQRHIPDLTQARGGSKKIYTKREHKKPTKEKTRIKKISRTIKSSKLKTTKKK